MAASSGIALGLLHCGASPPASTLTRRRVPVAPDCSRSTREQPNPALFGPETPRQSAARALAAAPRWLAVNRRDGGERPRRTSAVHAAAAGSAEHAASEGGSDRGEKLRRAWFLVVVELASFLLILAPSPIPLPSLPTSPLLHALGVLPVALGVALLAVATWQLRGLTPSPVPSKNAVLQTQGAFGIVRNPMWSSLLLIGTGVTVATGSPLRAALLAVLAWTVDEKAKIEEGFLAERFGDEYVTYSKRVKRIIPFLY